MSAPIRVLLVDDQTLVRQGIRSLLALDNTVEVVAEARDGVEALEQVEAVRPDIVLLDLRMPRMGGIEVLNALREKDFAPPSLVLTTFDDDEAVLDALRAGARGYLLKDVTLEAVVDAIRTVAAGGRLVQPALTQGLIERIADRAPRSSAASAGPMGSAVPAELTPREVEVLRLMVGGYANREIGQALHLAEGTVKNHVSAILLKLGVRDRTRAVLRGLELGLVAGRSVR